MKKIFYCLCAAVLFGTIVSAAKATPIATPTFKAQVLDPPSGYILDGLEYEINPPSPPGTPLGSIPITFRSDTCETNPVLPSDSYCALIVNDSGVTITSLELVFSSTSLGGDPSCDPGSYPGNNLLSDGGTTAAIFTGENCSFDPTTDVYTLDFFGGTGISGNNTTFEVVETGADPSDFPAGLTAAPNVPEPASVWMLSTAALMGGLLFAGRRRIQAGL